MNKNIEQCVGYYNGYDTYPIKRFTDIIGVDILNKANLNIASTSYDITTTLQYDAVDPSYSAATIIGQTSPTDEIELSIFSTNIYKRATKSIDTCIDTGNFDVLCGWNIANNTLYCLPSYLRLSLNYNTDDVVDSATFAYNTYRPFVLKFSGTTAADDMLNAIRSIKTESRNNSYSPYDTYEYVLEHYSSQVIKMKGITDGVEDYVWGLKETNNKFYKNLYSANDPKRVLVYPDNTSEMSMVTLYLEGNSTIPNSMGSIWTYTQDKAYGNNKAYEINGNNFLVFGGREYYHTHRDCMIERDLRVFDFSEAYIFQQFRLSDFTRVSYTTDGQIIDFDLSFTISGSGVTINNNEMEVGFKAWSSNGTAITEQDLLSSYAEVNEDSAIVHAKGRVSSVTPNITLQFFFKNGNGLIYGTSFKINVSTGQIATQ